MSSSTDLNKTYEVVINVGYNGFRLTDHMMKELGIDNPFPCQQELPRHNKDLVRLVREGHGTTVYNGKTMGLVVKTISEKTYRICEYDGYEYIETPNSIKWTIANSE